ncbi:MAG: hypothetical protein OSA51_06495 [Octadecabacter sp.]|nr:hypothetical protein [Octadecabacter sp.]
MSWKQLMLDNCFAKLSAVALMDLSALLLSLNIPRITSTRNVPIISLQAESTRYLLNMSIITTDGRKFIVVLSVKQGVGA